MASPSDLVPLRKMLEALRDIRRSLVPFLKIVERHRGSTTSGGNATNDDGTADGVVVDPHTLAEARAAVALAVGTLRYMSNRLGGKGGGGGANKYDPLRLELDKMRKMMVTLRGIDKREGGTGRTAAGGNNTSNSASAAAAAAAAGTKLAVPTKNDAKSPRRSSSSDGERQSAAAGDDGKNTTAGAGRVLDVTASKRMVKAALVESSGTASKAKSDASPGLDLRQRKRKERSLSPTQDGDDAYRSGGSSSGKKRKKKQKKGKKK